MTRFITIPPFVLPRFTWLVYLLLLGAPHPRQPENIAQQGARQAACSTTYDSADPRELALVSTKAASSGVLMNTYRHVGSLRTESFADASG
jgi:hypothetical protein